MGLEAGGCVTLQDFLTNVSTFIAGDFLVSFTLTFSLLVIAGYIEEYYSIDTIKDLV